MEAARRLEAMLLFGVAAILAAVSAVGIGAVMP